jgi:hypothetical protein
LDGSAGFTRCLHPKSQARVAAAVSSCGRAGGRYVRNARGKPAARGCATARDANGARTLARTDPPAAAANLQGPSVGAARTIRLSFCQSRPNRPSCFCFVECKLRQDLLSTKIKNCDNTECLFAILNATMLFPSMYLSNYNLLPSFTKSLRRLNYL